MALDPDRFPTSPVTAQISTLRKLAKIAEWTEAPEGRNRFGEQIILLGDAAYTALQRSRAFDGLPFSAKDLAEVLTELRDAGETRAQLTRLATDANNSYQTLAVRASDMIGKTIRATAATLENPAAPGEVKAEVQAATERLRELHGASTSQRVTAMLATRSRKAVQASATSTVNRLELEKRFLTGEELRPVDLQAAPMTASAPKRGRRRAPR